MGLKETFRLLLHEISYFLFGKAEQNHHSTYWKMETGSMAFRPMDVCSSPHFAIHYLYDNRSTINNRNILMAYGAIVICQAFYLWCFVLEKLYEMGKKLSQRELM